MPTINPLIPRSLVVLFLKELAPPGHPHAVKVRVSPLGVVKILQRD